MTDNMVLMSNHDTDKQFARHAGIKPTRIFDPVQYLTNGDIFHRRSGMYVQLNHQSPWPHNRTQTPIWQLRVTEVAGLTAGEINDLLHHCRRHAEPLNPRDVLREQNRLRKWRYNQQIYQLKVRHHLLCKDFSHMSFYDWMKKYETNQYLAIFGDKTTPGVMKYNLRINRHKICSQQRFRENKKKHLKIRKV